MYFEVMNNGIKCGYHLPSFDLVGITFMTKETENSTVTLSKEYDAEATLASLSESIY